MKTSALILVPALLLPVGCADETVGYPSAEGKALPYIQKVGCTFTITAESGSAGVTSPTVSGDAGASAAASVSLGDMSITVSDCRVVANSHRLPIYED